MVDRDDNFCVFNNRFECNKRLICSQKGVLVVEFEANDIDGNNNNVVNGDGNFWTQSSIIVFGGAPHFECNMRQIFFQNGKVLVVADF